MFYGKFEITNSILITDFTFNSFQLFIEYLYTGTLKLNEFEEMESLMEITGLAQKYLIDDLRKKCVSRLREMLSNENVFSIFTKAFEFHLEDFLVSCLYFFVEALESGVSLCNSVMNGNEENGSCFEFLFKNLLDYFGDRQEVLLLIKAWSLDNDLKVRNLNLDELLTDKIINMKAAFLDGASGLSKCFHRIYYKPVRPFIIEKGQNYFDITLSFKKFIKVNHLMINSRLIPEQFDFCDMSNLTYEEDLEVEIFEKSTNSLVFKKDHQIIENVAFNANFNVKISDRMILFPSVYVFRIKWNENLAMGFEYPRAIFSSDEKCDVNRNQQSVVQFHDYHFNFPHGSIVQGIFYEIVN